MNHTTDIMREHSPYRWRLGNSRPSCYRTNMNSASIIGLYDYNWFANTYLGTID